MPSIQFSIWVVIIVAIFTIFSGQFMQIFLLLQENQNNKRFYSFSCPKRGVSSMGWVRAPLTRGYSQLWKVCSSTVITGCVKR